MPNHDNHDSKVKGGNAGGFGNKFSANKKNILVVAMVVVCAIPIGLGIMKLTESSGSKKILFPPVGQPSNVLEDGAPNTRPVHEGYVEDEEGNRFKVTIDEVDSNSPPEVAPFDGTFVMSDAYELDDAVGTTARMLRAIQNADIQALTALGMQDMTQESLAKLAEMYAPIINSQDTQVRLSFGTLESSWHQVNVVTPTFSTIVIVDYNKTTGYSIPNPILPVELPTAEPQSSEDLSESSEAS